MSEIKASLAAAATYLTASFMLVAVVFGFAVKAATLPRRRPTAKRSIPAPRTATTACPDWCTTVHNGLDVEHEGNTVDLTDLSLVGGAIAAGLVQRPGQSPRLLLAVCEPDDEVQETEIAVALHEAAQLVQRLTLLLASARADAN